MIQRTAGKEFGQVFVYDELDRVKQRLFPDGETFHYGYDGIRLTSIRADAANPAFKGQVLKSADYDALGRMKTIEVGETTGGATLVTNTYSYDATHARLTRVQGAVPGSTPLDLSVAFDGLGRLSSQTGTLGAESVSRSYSYDGLSRLKTAVGPWEKASGATGNVTWSYSYDALGNLRGQASTRSPANLADVRTWSYAHTTKPRFLTSFAQANQPTETLGATLGGEVATIARPSLPTETLVWNALGKLRQHKNSTYSYDAFGELVQTVTGPSGSPSSIVSVGEDFEYDITALRSNKYFSIQGVRIASLATSYTAPSASVPPALRIVLRYAEPLAAPAAAALLALGLLSLASLTLRRRTPVWLSLPGVGVLSFTLVALPYTAHAATLTSGPGTYGRHGEPILAYLVDHLGTIRGAVNQAGVVVETRDYAPFGESIAHTGTFSVQHRFTGQPQDDQAGGLYNYGARFYNAKWGRFASLDGIVQGFDSQGLNPFAYVLNAPTSAVDPTGNFLWWIVTVPLTIALIAAMRSGPSDYDTGDGDGGGGGGGAGDTMPDLGTTPDLSSMAALSPGIAAGAEVPGLYVYRDSIDTGKSAADTHFGHYWVEDKVRDKSWGWYPEEPTSSRWQVLFGVPGSLNQGDDNDPHHGTGDDDSRVEKFGVATTRSYGSRDDIVDAIEEYATSFKGDWSWPLGPNCRTFQEDMFEELGLETVPLK